MKICSKCKSEKQLSDFPRAKRELDGYGYQCKKCKYEYRKIQDSRARSNTVIDFTSMLKREDVASYLGVSISGVIALEKRGLKREKIRGIVYYDRDEVNNFMESNKVNVLA